MVWSNNDLLEHKKTINKVCTLISVADSLLSEAFTRSEKQKHWEMSKRMINWSNTCQAMMDSMDRELR